MAHRHLHGLVVLIQRRGPYLDDSLLGPRLRGAGLEHFAFDAEFIARPNRPRPPEFVEADANDAAGWPQIAVDQQSHRDRGGVPAASGKPAEYGLSGGSFIEMKWLWIEFGGKALDAVRIDADASGRERLSRVKVLQVSVGHNRLRSWLLYQIDSGRWRSPRERARGSSRRVFHGHD
jgi:hypothetical protein